MTTKPIETYAQFTKLSGRAAKPSNIRVNKVPLSSSQMQVQATSFRPKNKFDSTMTAVMNKDDFAQLLEGALATANGTYCVSSDCQEERFLYVTRIPAGYVGRSIDGAGTKEKGGIDYVVLVVVAPQNGNSLVMNMYPCAATYYANRTRLV